MFTVGLARKFFYVVSTISVILFLVLFVYYTGDRSRLNLYHVGDTIKPMAPHVSSPELEKLRPRKYVYIEPIAVRNSSRSSQPKGYMFTLRTLEQLTMATAHFHQFQNLVNDWGFTGVEPFVYGSTMYGLRSLHVTNANGFVPFSTLFNASIHNDYLSKCMKREPDPETGYPVLFEPTREFLRRSYRKIILVHFAASKELNTVFTSDLPKRMETEINKEKGPFMDCTSAAQAQGMVERVETLLAKELELERLKSSHPKSLPSREDLTNFTVTQVVCIKRGPKISLRDLRDFVLGHIHREGGAIEVSIIFTSWQGRFTHPLVDSDVNNYINLCRIPFSEPFHSDYILKTTERYLNSLDLHGQPYISVHIRFEKLFLLAMSKGIDTDKFVTCCMTRLNTVLLAVAEKFNIVLSKFILLNWDYSPYGSMDYAWPIDPRRTQTITSEQIKKVKARPVYFDPRKFGVPAENSIVSLVEMNALLKGSALVTVGGGSYEHTIAQTFLEHHRDPDHPEAAELLHFGHICTGKPDSEHLHGVSVPPKCFGVD